MQAGIKLMLVDIVGFSLRLDKDHRHHSYTANSKVQSVI